MIFVLRLVDYIARNYRGKVVEVGIGFYWDVAIALSERSFDVIATDVKDISIGKRGIKFVVDDISNPDLEIYRGAILIYSIRPPPELFEAIKRTAISVGADAIVKPLHNEFPDGWDLVNFNGLSFYVSKVRKGYEGHNR